MNNKNIFILALFILVIAVIAMLIIQSDEEVPEEEISNMPSVLLAHSFGIERAEYDMDLGEYIGNSFYESRRRSFFQINTTDDFIFLTTRSSIVRIDENLNEKSLAVYRVGETKTNEKNVFVSTKDGKFISFNEDLEELSSVKLNHKYAHDVIIHNDSAYLLDNIMDPFYIFKIDIGDPENIKIVKEVELWGVYLRLLVHWLNPDLDRWMVVQRESGSGGTWEFITVFSMSEVVRKGGKTTFSHNIHDEDGEGYRIVKVTPFSPAWSVVLKEDKYYLAHIYTEDNSVSEVIYLELNDYGDGEFVIKKHEDNVFLASGNNLQVFNVKGDPRLVLVHEAEHKIRDFVFVK